MLSQYTSVSDEYRCSAVVLEGAVQGRGGHAACDHIYARLQSSVNTPAVTSKLARNAGEKCKFTRVILRRSTDPRSDYDCRP